MVINITIVVVQIAYNCIVILLIYTYTNYNIYSGGKIPQAALEGR